MALFGSSEESLQIVINARDEATKVIKKVEKTTVSFKKRIDALQPTFRKMAVAGTASFAAIAVGANSAIKKARDFEEESNKFAVVFKDISKEAQEMADTLNKSYGLSRLESKRLLSSTGDILTGFGFTGKAALDLSSKVNTLAVDLASFTNAQGGAEAVSSALTKALLGERESLKTYGIAIQEADVQAELLKNGMDELTGEALRQAKAQVTLDIAFRQSKNAVGDYARSTGTLTQTQKELAKSIEDTQIAIGETLAPILNDLLKRIVPIVEKVLAWVELNPELTKRIILISAALAALVAILGTLGIILPAIISFFALLTPTVGLVIGILAALGFAVMNVVKIVDTFANHWDEVWDGVKITFFEIWDAIKEKINSVVGVITDQIDRVIALFNKMKSIVTQPIKSVGRSISGAFSGVAQTIGGVFKEHGGIVQGPSGQPVPIIAHGQEQVIPASRVKGSNGNIFNVTFNNPIVRDASDIEVLKKEMDRYFRQLNMNHKLAI